MGSHLDVLTRCCSRRFLPRPRLRSGVQPRGGPPPRLPRQTAASRCPTPAGPPHLRGPRLRGPPRPALPWVCRRRSRCRRQRLATHPQGRVLVHPGGAPLPRASAGLRRRRILAGHTGSLPVPLAVALCNVTLASTGRTTIDLIVARPAAATAALPLRAAEPWRLVPPAGTATATPAPRSAAPGARQPPPQPPGSRRPWIPAAAPCRRRRAALLSAARSSRPALAKPG